MISKYLAVYLFTRSHIDRSYLKYFKISLQISNRFEPPSDTNTRQNFDVCIQNKTSTKQRNRNLTRT